jgi:serine/threonine-protein phosphatase 2A activator
MAMPPPPLPPTAAPAGPTEEISLPSDPAPPAQVLTTDAAVAAWPQTPGYRGYILWLRRRCERIRGRSIVEGKAGASGVGAGVRLVLTVEHCCAHGRA